MKKDDVDDEDDDNHEEEDANLVTSYPDTDVGDEGDTGEVGEGEISGSFKGKMMFIDQIQLQ